MNQKHKFSDLIKALADGATIEARTPNRPVWETLGAVGELSTPAWMEGCEYRIKPEPKYPETRFTGKQLDEIYMRTDPEGDLNMDFIAVANAAIRRAIQDGDVVLPEGK